MLLIESNLFLAISKSSIHSKLIDVILVYIFLLNLSKPSIIDNSSFKFLLTQSNFTAFILLFITDDFLEIDVYSSASIAPHKSFWLYDEYAAEK